MTHLGLAAVLLVAIVVACEQEPDLHLDIADKAIPSFSFSGRTPATVFEILEVPRTKPLNKIDPYSVTGETVWQITASGKMKAADWPVVTYAKVPDGFSQTVPASQSPGKLAPGKLYVARIVGEQDYKSGFFFEVQNDRIVNVTDKIFGP